MIKKSLITALIFLLAWTTIGGVTPSHAAGGLSLFTPYTGISVTPGESIDYMVDLNNNTNSIQNVSFDLKDIPKKWDYEIKSGSWAVQKLSVKPGKKQQFTLTVNVPLKVEKGDYSFTLVSKGSDGLDSSLPLTVTVSEKGTFQTELDVDQPNMQGHADADFSYTATLSNKTADKQRYALSADAPKGWDTEFKADGKTVTSVEIKPNESKDINITLNPPEKVKADTYQARIKASNGSTSAKNVIEAAITGTYDMDLTTPSGKLSTNITAGKSKTVELKVVNKGSAPLEDVSLTSTAPPDWDVTFDSKSINKLAPGKSMNVKATITASDDAIAGDYVTKVSASSGQVNSDAELRVSVKTSMLWGWVGVLIIIAVLAGIYYLFRKYGRR